MSFNPFSASKNSSFLQKKDDIDTKSANTVSFLEKSSDEIVKLSDNEDSEEKSSSDGSVTSSTAAVSDEKTVDESLPSLDEEDSIFDKSDDSILEQTMTNISTVHPGDDTDSAEDVEETLSQLEEGITKSEPVDETIPEAIEAAIEKTEVPSSEKSNQINVLEVPVTSENVALNILITFVNLAQKRGAFNIQESSKIWECINQFKKSA